MEATYWSGQGKYQAEFQKLTEELMPAQGEASTVAGEMIRACNRLAYDFYNNGMGNNTSGALNYLVANGCIDTETYCTVYPYTLGRLYRGQYNGDRLQLAIERIIDMTMEFIRDTPETIRLENTESIFDYEADLDDEEHEEDIRGED